MINVSNEYKSKIRKERYFISKATLKLSDDTIIELAGQDIMSGGSQLEDSVSEQNTFSIGSAIINSCKIILNNFNGKFDEYDFTDAVITLYIGLKLSTTIEYLKKGVFTVDDSVNTGSTIILSCLDNMGKFDKPFSDVNLSFPCTALQLIQAVSLYCGVVFTTSTFTNDNFEIQIRPDDEAITCREIVAWVAQLSGNFARCNSDGALELKWYDFGAFELDDNLNGGDFSFKCEYNTSDLDRASKISSGTIIPNESDYEKYDINNDGEIDIFDVSSIQSILSASYNTGDNIDGGDFSFTESTSYSGGLFTDMSRYHHIYSIGNNSKIATDDIIITGIQVVDSSDVPQIALFGETGYIVSIEDNPLIQDFPQATFIANSVGAKIVGMKFRPCSISSLSDPSIEAGDVAYITDKKNNTYQIVITNVIYKMGSNIKISCDAETPSKKASVRFSAKTKAIIASRKVAKQEISNYDLMVQQFSNLISNAMGMFRSQVITENGGTIEYIIDKPTMEESTVRWYIVSGNLVEESKLNGVWTLASGTDKQGNALYNVLTARGINANWINAGTITARDYISKTNGYGDIRIVDGTLWQYDTDGNKVFSLGKISGSNPYIGIKLGKSFGFGTTDNFASFSNAYMYSSSAKLHSLYGDAEFNGSLNLKNGIKSNGSQGISRDITFLTGDNQVVTLTVSDGLITNVQFG